MPVPRLGKLNTAMRGTLINNILFPPLSVRSLLTRFDHWAGGYSTQIESLGEVRNDWSKESDVNVFAERKMIRHMLPSRRHHHLLVPVCSLKSLCLFLFASPTHRTLLLEDTDYSRGLQALAGSKHILATGRDPASEPATWTHPPTQLPSNPVFSSST